jgi:type III restriction enzyme
VPETPTDESLLDSGAAGYVVDRVVICDAFREPERHYALLPGGRSRLVDGRRKSLRYRATARQVKGGAAGVIGKEASLFEDMFAAEEQLNEFVNLLRDEVREWRQAGWPGTAIVTGKLLDWWFGRNEERTARHQRFFFCQQEAIETVIYLYEVKRRQSMPETGNLLRYALKLATGTGKTVVMALLVTWSTLHKRKVAGSPLSANFLVLVPNLTVRDRVRGIDERTGLSTGAGLDPSSSENLYDQFDMVPLEYAEDFRPNVMVRNWHAIPLEDQREDWIPDRDVVGEGRFVPASVLTAMQRRVPRDGGASLRRYLRGWRDLMIINDEAHHVYGEKRSSKSDEPGYIKWSRIIDEIATVASISLVVDLSATPWYGSGSPKPEGTLFEWLVSDFSVYDAFESGLVKVVRLPDPDEQGRVYLDLWDLVKQARTKEEYLRAGRGAIEHIYSGWKRDFVEWDSHLFKLGPPPVMLVVANDATRAKWLFEHLTTQYADLLGNSDPEDPSTWVTIQVDSKVFDADRGSEATLREMVNTVGQANKPGEHVRCIVSVNMLSEGWDVKNVSHIIGFRAFGSPLLTEQVIGRGLRRTDYTVLNQPIEERLANVNRPDEETVDAFGIPFVGFPVERRKRPRAGKWGQTPTPIEPDPKKIRFSVWVPNVRSWALTTSELLTNVIDIDRLEAVLINPRETPTEVRVRPVVGGARGADDARRVPGGVPALALHVHART